LITGKFDYRWGGGHPGIYRKITGKIPGAVGGCPKGFIQYTINTNRLRSFEKAEAPGISRGSSCLSMQWTLSAPKNQKTHDLAYSG
jgi:hypothetical protein